MRDQSLWTRVLLRDRRRARVPLDGGLGRAVVVGAGEGLVGVVAVVDQHCRWRSPRDARGPPRRCPRGSPSARRRSAGRPRRGRGPSPQPRRRAAGTSWSGSERHRPLPFRSRTRGEKMPSDAPPGKWASSNSVDYSSARLARTLQEDYARMPVGPCSCARAMGVRRLPQRGRGAHRDRGRPSRCAGRRPRPAAAGGRTRSAARR